MKNNFLFFSDEKNNWKWKIVNENGNTVIESSNSFLFLEKCKLDALKNGWLNVSKDFNLEDSVFLSKESCFIIKEFISIFLNSNSINNNIKEKLKIVNKELLELEI